MTSDPTTPSAVQQHSTFKPRLLYRGPLRLADGTLLPGVAFVSTVSPFDSSPSSSQDKGDNYDAEICLALEMVRGQRVVGIDLLDQADVRGTGERGGVGDGVSGRQKVDGREVDVTIEATGRVKMYIDPREQATASFFERHFCWRDDWSKLDRIRGRHVFALSTAPTSHDFQFSDSQSQDPFVSSYSQGFGPPAVVDGKAHQLILFARLADESSTSEDGSRGLDIVVGRRLVKRRKAKQALAKQPRPDDPLPRAAALADLMLSQRGGPPPRSSSPADLPLPARSHASKWARTPSLGVSATSVGEVTGEHSQGPASAAAQLAEIVPRARSAGGNHTPGRRGEKRQKAAMGAEREGGTPAPGSPSQMLASPSKRRRADEVDLTTTSKRRMERTSSSASAAATASKSQSLRPPSLTPSSRKSRKVTPSSSAAVTPELPDSAVFSSFEEADESSASRTEGVKPIKGSGSKTGANPSSSSYSALETRNRGTIKKLVQHQLLGRGLERGDEDFERCFTAAYHGTALALRHTLSNMAVERLQAAQLVACHLGMYLPASPPILPPTVGVGVNPGESQAQTLNQGYSSRGVKVEIKDDEGSEDEAKKPLRDALSPF
ncbi:hypothetical protein BCV69DRAFT_311499 [Microstroma glucosiphilum]|uniref:Sld7 C-terminal domain-containing protein n=1 Tax=Pseudomicrostroma glucosiphilum TaxID=1684307 RepID=A0A316U9E8_9BASI|nr:hypothetical protein BCV69DRAFT_311499 [Pseudomicrostroma glucosiphilum]PWN21779.1 hypothetical protein BCV69DRAFT_311499 [Pseudomicrostroma glucosiphilum]